jgi:hypothetical protein
MDSVKIIAVGALPNIPRETDVTSLDLGADANPEGVALTPDGRFGLITRAGAKTLAYVDLTGLTPALLPGGTKVARGAFGITVTPDGAKALVTNKTGGTLSVVDLTGLPVMPSPAAVTTLTVGESPGAVAVTPDGRTAVIAEGEARMPRGSSISRRSPRRPSRSPHPPPPIPTPSGWRSWPVPADRWRPSRTRRPARCRSSTSPARLLSRRSTPGPARRASRCFPSRRRRPPLDGVEQRGGSIAVTFDGTRSSDRDGAIVSYTFTFGDGTSVTSPVPIVTHTYTTVGKFVASLVVTDDDGTTVRRGPHERAGGAEQAAQGRAEGERDDGKAPFLVTFDASRSKDSDGTIASYTFTFGDGSSVTTSNPVATHTYVSPGSTRRAS